MESKKLLDEASTSSAGAIYNAARLKAKQEGHTEEASILGDIAKNHGAKVKGSSKPQIQGSVI